MTPAQFRANAHARLRPRSLAEFVEVVFGPIDLTATQRDLLRRVSEGKRMVAHLPPQHRVHYAPAYVMPRLRTEDKPGLLHEVQDTLGYPLLTLPLEAESSASMRDELDTLLDDCERERFEPDVYLVNEAEYARLTDSETPAGDE